MNGDDPFLSFKDCNDIHVLDCVFSNTGKFTKNSIFNIDNPDRSSAMIVAKGNFKSHSLENISNRLESRIEGFSDWD